MSSTNFHFFGTGAVIGANRQPLPMRSRKQLGLLAYLATEYSTVHSRETLMALFWPESDISTARNNLRVTLSRLRKIPQQVGVDAQKIASQNSAMQNRELQNRELLITDRFDVQWNSAYSNLVDVNQFNQLLDETRHHQHVQRSQCEDCQRRLQAAVALYHGDLLDGFALDSCPAFEEWLFIQRERLHLLALEAYTDLALFSERSGDLAAALTSIRRQIELDPLRELAYRQQMRILAMQGERSLALAAFERCRNILYEELGIDPEPETLALHEQIVAGTFEAEQKDDGPDGATLLSLQVEVAPDAATSGAKGEHKGAQHNLPQQLTPFIGRSEELEQLHTRLSDPVYRLISLIGPGGIGKSRLALQVAAHQIHTFSDGVYFVSLAQVQSADAISTAIAKTLGVTFRQTEKSLDEQIVEMLQKRHLLLILDNFEHLTAGVALLIEILQHAPNVVLLVTSRERLNVQSEDLFVLQGLPVPQDSTDSSARNKAAVHLFVDRAYRLNKQFKLTDDVLPDVIRLCQILEGLPLALELAATWIRELSCAEIVAELTKGFDILEAPLSDVKPQHHSLRAVFDSSWNLLSAAEQETLATLTLFRGGFTTQSAKAVAGTSMLLLSQLCYKSLLYTTGSWRYDMHEMVRQFAAEKLSTLDQQQESVRKHSTYFLEFLHQRSDALNGPDPQNPQSEIRVELDNVRAAWHAAIEHVPLEEAGLDSLCRSVTGLARFYRMVGLNGEGSDRFAKALDQLEQYRLEQWKNSSDAVAPLRVRLLLAHSRMNIRMGKLSEAAKSAQEAVTAAQVLDDIRRESQAYTLLGYTKMQSGHPGEACSLLEKALALARQGADRAQEGIILRRLGTALMNLDKRVIATEYLQQALEISQEQENLNEEQAVALYLGVSAAEKGNYQEAQKYLTLTLDLIQRVGNRSLEARIQNAVGYVTAAMGDWDAALPFHQRSRQIAHDIAEPLQESHALHNLCTVERKRGELPLAEEHGREALRLARIDNLPDALAYAWLHLGYVWADQQRPDDATSAFQESQKLWAEQERNTLAIEALAGLAGAKLACGDSKAAATCADKVLDFLYRHNLDGVDEPFQIYLSIYRVLVANHDQRSASFLTEACDRLTQMAERIDDPLLRTQYLNATVGRLRAI